MSRKKIQINHIIIMITIMMNIKILIDYLNYLYIDDNKINKYIIKYLNLLYFNFKIYVLINKLYLYFYQNKKK